MNYVQPSCLQFLTPYLLKAQATGSATINQTPSNPNANCNSASCIDNQTQYELTMLVSWSDDAGTPVGEYTVSVDIGITNVNLSDATTGCNITEPTSSNYQLDCQNAPITSVFAGLCNCSASHTITVVSINDGTNTLNVNDACSNIIPSNC